jgi:hypothetical protein
MILTPSQASTRSIYRKKETDPSESFKENMRTSNPLDHDYVPLFKKGKEVRKCKE